MPDINPSFSEYPLWLTPADALAFAMKLIPDRKAATEAILARLKSGAIRSVTAKTTIARAASPPTAIETINAIPPPWWTHLSQTRSPTLWPQAEARFFFERGRQGDSVRGSETVRCFGIRLDPRAVHSTFPEPHPTGNTNEPTL